MPVEKQGIFVYRFDYELKGNPWTAYVAGYGQEQCQDYLIETVGDINVITLSQECALHAITNQLRQKIMDGSKRKPGRPPLTAAAKKA